MKSPAIIELEALAIVEAKRNYPGLPESHYSSTRKYSDKTANGLTKCIIDWLRLNRWQCERISVTGRYVDNSRLVTNCIGQVKRIGGGKWIKPSMQRGTADISATIKGQSIKIECKIGRDKQSAYQRQYQLQVETAGGVYLLIKDFQSFYDWYKKQSPAPTGL